MSLRCSYWLILLTLCSWDILCANWNVTMHEGRRYVPVQDVANFYRLHLSVSSGRNFQMSAGQYSVRGTAGSREVFINGVKHILCFPAVQRGGTVLLSAMDVTKIIEPVLRPGKIRDATRVRTVILDAGHGGHDSGATGRYGREKEFALDVALRAKVLLEQRGFQVKMTRTRDVFVPLEQRSAFANRHRDAIFVSIHFNKGKTSAGTGVETFCLAPRGVPSMGEDAVTVNALREYPGHARDAENVALATAMHSTMLRYLNLPDRGVKRGRFHVIRETKIPSVLLEGGFVDHPTDGRLIATPQFRQRMAMAIADGVSQFQRAVEGRSTPLRPNVIARGNDATTAPSLPPRVGTRTSLAPSVASVMLEDSAPKQKSP
jgi:N-acetylmuramoyl-L-alanine amidase